jgi:uncharacterized tellurite resistance protein B-like protein
MSQEIYDDLGQMGSVLMLGTMVAAVDGEVDKKEMESLINVYLNLTSSEEPSPEHFGEIMEKVSAAHKSLETFENKLKFAATVLNTFKSSFDEDLRKALMQEYTAIASADFEVHENETALLGLYAKHLL